MNELLAGIYGTGGFEKTASAGGENYTLADLALSFANDAVGQEDHVKLASARDDIFEHLASFDRAGRAIAQHEFAQMEKAAHAGDPSAIEAFFSDVIEEEPEEVDPRSAVLAEIERRLGQ
jgi:hypothetical protein